MTHFTTPTPPVQPLDWRFTEPIKMTIWKETLHAKLDYGGCITDALKQINIKDIIYIITQVDYIPPSQNPGI